MEISENNGNLFLDATNQKRLEIPRMAPRLSTSQHEQILSMTVQEFSNDEIAEFIPCTVRAVRRI